MHPLLPLRPLTLLAALALVAVAGAQTPLDPVLENAVRQAVGVPEAELTPDDLARVQTLELMYADATDLQGIERLEQLDTLVSYGTQITDLSHLARSGARAVYFLQNQLHDVDLSPLAAMPELEALGLVGNGVSDADLAVVGDLERLAFLDLNGNEITDIAPLAALERLEELELQSNRISSIAPLAELSNLAVLRLSENAISDVSPLAELSSLEVLSLMGNPVADFAPVAGLDRLVSLSLTDTGLEDPRPLRGLVDLERLNLDDNELRDAESLAFLTEWQALRQVDLSDNPWSDPAALEALAEQLEAQGVRVFR